MATAAGGALVPRLREGQVTIMTDDQCHPAQGGQVMTMTDAQ